MNLNRTTMKNLRYLITFTVLLYLGVENVNVVLKYVGLAWGLVLPFVIGAALAFVLNVPMSFIERHLFGKAREKGHKTAKKLARPVSLVLSIFFVICIILLVGFVVVPELGTTVMNVAKKLEEDIPLIQEWLETTFRDDSQIVQWANSIDIQPEKMLNSVASVLQNGVDNILSSTITVTKGILSTAMNIGIAFVFACYVLLQKEKLRIQVKKAAYAVFPEHVVKYVNHVFSIANRIFANFITGQCIEAVILGSMFFVVMSVLRYPYAMLVGVLIAFTALIPVFGGFIGCWISFILIFLVSPVKAVTFLIIFLVLQQIEGNFIYPHVVGNSVGLPAIWVLMAVTTGGSLMGVMGMLIFIPLVSVAYTLFREWVYKRLKEKKINVS